jgi:EAL domain-containing protein (putative c-di-GMP-specific phosphodiesterase class I)/CHASE2 domain-containing sensor protein
MKRSALRTLAERWRLAAFTFAAAAGLLVLWTGAGDGLDQGLRNRRAALSEHPASGQVHIVAIDDKSIAAFRQWPWPRRIHAAAIDRLREAGAAVIAFDVDFSSPSLPADDATLAAALRRAGGSVVLPTFRRSGVADAAPIPPFASAAFLATANVFTEADGELRDMPYGDDVGGVPRPSLASLVAEHPGGAGALFPIDRSIDPASIPRHSMVDIVEGRVPASELAGKRILIGATAIEVGDRYTVARHGLLPGVLVQALAAETLLEGSPPAPGPGGWLLAAALLLAAGALRVRRAPLFALGFAAALPAILLLFLAAERLLGLDLPVAPALVALLAAAGAGGAGFAASRRREDSLTDPETGLANLTAIERDCGGSSLVTVVVARIDDFAGLLSTLGAGEAGQLVRRVADRLALGASGGRIYRIDEAGLAWIERGDSDLEDRFEAVHALMRAPFPASRKVEVRTHFGAARGPAGSAMQLCADAGLAALHAAERGARWQWFTPEDSERASWRVSLLADLDSAIESGGLWNAYQPKLDLATGRIVAVEALVRWDHPQRGTLSPDTFIPLIERHGRAADLTLHVLAQALKDTSAWHSAGCPIGVAVNISATLLHDRPFLHRLQQLLRSSGLPADRVTLEVTESAAMADPDAAVPALEGWRGLGVGVSIDDYGTGQSSLSYLQKMPATELKIDRSFIAAMAGDPRNRILVGSTIAMAHELGLRVVAEGVEDEACLDLLGEMGCDEAQGYWISRPIRGEAVAGFARRRFRRPATSEAAKASSGRARR